MTPHPINVSTKANWRQIFANVPPRTGARIASIGLALILILLAICAIWGAVTTRNAAARATQASQISDLYQQARFAVAEEESLERKYRLEPSPEVAARYYAAADALVKALEAAGPPENLAEHAFVVDVLAAHRVYLDATRHMFAEVDAGHADLVIAIDNNEADPAFSVIETQVDQAATTYHEQALQALNDLDQAEALVFSTTPIAFALGLILLTLFWGILHSLNRRLELAGQLETQREIERVKKNAELEAALAANRAKSTFLATMSHEFRTPLTAIFGYTELMKMQAEHYGYQELVVDIERIWTSGKHLLALINDVLDLSKIEAGKAELYIEDINLRVLIDDLVSANQPLVAKNGNRLTLVAAEDLGSMRTDATKLRQVLLNLLSNAAKFTQQGEIVLGVELDQRADDVWVRFSISDTGIGLSAEQSQHIFQPFIQADASTTRKYGGTGLGLALCKHLCTLLGGQITLESTLGAGSTFVVTLPAHMAYELTATTAWIEYEAEEVDPFDSDADDSAIATVLVIDDDPQCREIIMRHLIGQGLNVECAASGAEGLRLARKLAPSAITLDVVMPGMDGWEVLTAFKADPLLADIPIIMLSIVDDKMQGFALGATDYLVKPIDRDRLVKLLQQHGRSSDSDLRPHNRTILLVEDDANVRAITARAISAAGWQVVEVATGRAALDWAATHTPALILLDLMLPELDGIQVLEGLHELPHAQHIPVVVVTAKELTPTERTYLHNSVAQVLQKGTYRLEDLLATVHDLAVRQQPNQDIAS